VCPYLQVLITNNSNGITDFHTSQIITPKSSQFAFTSHFLVTDINNEDSSASVLTLLLPSKYPTNEVNSLDLGSWLYRLGVNPTENTASNSFSIDVMGSCPAIARISLTYYWPLPSNASFFS
jgi:hypothetical protein